MEAVYSSETLVFTYKSRRRYNPEDQHLHRRENLKSCTATYDVMRGKKQSNQEEPYVRDFETLTPDATRCLHPQFDSSSLSSVQYRSSSRSRFQVFPVTWMKAERNPALDWNSLLLVLIHHATRYLGLSLTWPTSWNETRSWKGKK
jgi:hypothetical protein